MTKKTAGTGERPTEPRAADETSGESEKKQGIGRELLVGTLLAVIGAMVGFVFTRPPTVAVLRCTPTTGPVPLEVECLDESTGASKTKWEIGADYTSEGSTRLTYRFERTGEHIVRLTAYGKDTDTSEISIKVFDPDELDVPLEVAVRAQTSEERIRQVKQFRIDETKDDHPSLLSSHSRRYTRSFEATSGFRIVDRKFHSESANFLSDFVCNIVSDDRRVDCSFMLKSGPGVDKKRGWIHGVLEIIEERIEPSRTLVLADSLQVNRVDRYGLSESVPIEAGTTLSISQVDGPVIVQGPVDSVLVASDLGLAFRLETEKGLSHLIVERASTTADADE